MFARFIRYLQGERPGMRAGRESPSPARRKAEILAPSISIDTQVLVPDVSFYQDRINFNTMLAAGAAGAIIRAGQNTWVDSQFHTNWPAARAAGLPRSTYWFYDSRVSPETQAALWWSLIKDDPGELPHFADFEESYGGPYGSKAHFKTFLLEFQRLSGLPVSMIGIYTGFYWWGDRVGNDPFFAQFPLWLAWYSSMSVVRVPLPWSESDLLFWQFTSHGNGPSYGVSSENIDLSWYCCNYQNFRERFNLDGTNPPPGNGGTMLYKRVNTTALNVRSGPGPGYQGIGYVQQDDHLIVSEISGGWARLVDARRGGWTGPEVTLNNGTTIAARAASTNDVWCKDSYLVDASAPPPDASPSSSVSPSVSPSASQSPSPSAGPCQTHTVDVYVDDVLVYHQELD